MSTSYWNAIKENLLNFEGNLKYIQEFELVHYY